MVAMDVRQLRSWWFERQGLPAGMPDATPEQVLDRVGWARSVAGINPYLTLFSRAGISREAADAAIAETRIHELPCARGCTFVVPRQDFALALKVGQEFHENGEIKGAKRYLGLTDDEIDRLGEKVLVALAEGPMDPAKLKTVLGDAVRNLGPEGKKRGMTTTLPLALGRLQSRGEIRRQPINGRLDQQRYAYARWEDHPLRGSNLSTEEAYVELARRYFRWIGPASLGHFQWLSGLGVKAAKAAVEPLGLVPLEAGSPLLMYPEDREALLTHAVSPEPRYALVASLDGLVLHRRELSDLLEPEDRTRQTRGEKSVSEMGGLQDLYSNPILDRGRIVGLWEFDAESQTIAWTSFVPADAAMRAEVARTETFVRDQVGDARSFSLDSPESRRPKVEFLRAQQP